MKGIRIAARAAIQEVYRIMTRRIRTRLVFLAAVLLLSANAWADTVSWNDWTSFTPGNLTGTAAGVITVGGSTVNVTYTGQVGGNSNVTGVGGTTSWLPASTFSGGSV